jgi:hypothetical protein
MVNRTLGWFAATAMTALGTLTSANAAPMVADYAAWTSSPLGSSGYSVEASRLLTVAGSNPNTLINATLRGEGYDGIAGLLVNTSIGSFICTGSLLTSGRDLLTAAHCLTDENGVVIADSVDAFFFPSDGGTFITTATDFRIRDGYTGAVIDDNDIAVIRLPEEITIPGIDRYDIWDAGLPVGNIMNYVGFGASGTGNTGAILSPGTRRQGYNSFDFLNSPGIYISDFDNGTLLNDASCWVAASLCDPGLGLFEVGLAGGDSGGPALFFDNGQNYLAGIASFGLTFGRFANPFGICVAVGSTDASSVQGNCAAGQRLALGPDLLPGLNSSFGEFSGHTNVALHASWIRAQLVPEPGSLALLAIALLAMCGATRRRTAVPAH